VQNAQKDDFVPHEMETMSDRHSIRITDINGHSNPYHPIINNSIISKRGKIVNISVDNSSVEGVFCEICWLDWIYFVQF
jgi:hypothetical protein